MTTILDDLLTLEDDLGVVTVQLGYEPADFADGPVTAPARVRAAIGELVDGLDGERGRAVRRRLDAESERIDALLDPRTPGRGRYLALGVADGDVREERLGVPLPLRVVLDDGPTIRGLLEAADEHAPTGVVLLHAEEALVLHLELGQYEPVVSLAADLTDRVFGDEFYGPSPSGPSSLRRGVTNREARGDRVQANLDRFLDEVADAVRAAADDLGWSRVVLVGPAHERRVVEAGLDDASVLHLDRIASGGSDDLMVDVERVVREAHRAEEVELVRTAVDQAAAGGAGAAGPVDVVRSLTEGRVHHLLLAHDVGVAGAVAPHGVLVAADDDRDVPEAHPTPRFLHRMIERALATDARVTPVDGEAAERLHDAGGVAALLRW